MSLTDAELEAIQGMLGSDAAVIASGIGRLFVSNPAANSKRKDPRSCRRRFPGIRRGKWLQTDVAGGVLLVMDRFSQCFYLMVVDLERMATRLEYEIYLDMDYRSLTPQFHAFEMDDLVAGFFFSDEERAKAMLIKVKMLKPSSKGNAPVNLIQGQRTLKRMPKAKAKAAKAKAKAKTKAKADKGRLRQGTVTTVARAQGGSKTTLASNRGASWAAGGSEARAGDPAALSPGSPHVSPWRPDGTINFHLMPPGWKDLLKRAGFRRRDLADPSLVALIRTCLEEVGIATAPPPRDLSRKQLQQYYSPEDVAKYEAYQEELLAYEAQMDEYGKLKAEHEAMKREMGGLEAWAKEKARQKERQRKQQTQTHTLARKSKGKSNGKISLEVFEQGATLQRAKRNKVPPLPPPRRTAVSAAPRPPPQLPVSRPMLPFVPDFGEEGPTPESRDMSAVPPVPPSRHRSEAGKVLAGTPEEHDEEEDFAAAYDDYAAVNSDDMPPPPLYDEEFDELESDDDAVTSGYVYFDGKDEGDSDYDSGRESDRESDSIQLKQRFSLFRKSKGRGTRTEVTQRHSKVFANLIADAGANLKSARRSSLTLPDLEELAEATQDTLMASLKDKLTNRRNRVGFNDDDVDDDDDQDADADW